MNKMVLIFFLFLGLQKKMEHFVRLVCICTIEVQEMFSLGISPGRGAVAQVAFPSSPSVEDVPLIRMKTTSLIQLQDIPWKCY